MFRKLEKSNVPTRYFHRAADKGILDEIDDLLCPPLTRTYHTVDPETGEKKTHTVQERFDYDCGCISIGIGKGLGNEPDGIFYRRSGERWMFGDYMPSMPGAAAKRAPFDEDAEVLIAIMAMTHDCVCDAPVLQTLFLEGEMAGDVENLILILAYDRADTGLYRRLNEMGVLFLYDDAGYVMDDGFKPYFPPHSIHPHHKNGASGDFFVDLALPLPLLGHFDAGEVTAAHALSDIYRRFPSLDCDAFHFLTYLDTWKMLEDGFLFADDLPSQEEIEELRRAEFAARTRKQKQPGKAAGGDFKPPSKEEREARQEEERKRQREHHIAQARRRALLRVFKDVHPLADVRKDWYSPALQGNKRILDRWQEKLGEYPVMLGLDGLGFVSGEADMNEFSLKLQALGRLLGIDQPNPDQKARIRRMPDVPFSSPSRRVAERMAKLAEAGATDPESGANADMDPDQVVPADGGDGASA